MRNTHHRYVIYEEICFIIIKIIHQIIITRYCKLHLLLKTLQLSKPLAISQCIYIYISIIYIYIIQFREMFGVNPENFSIQPLDGRVRAD